MTYAIIETGGKQIKVFEGQAIWTEKIDQEVNTKIDFNKVIAIFKDEKLHIGKPYVEGAKIVGTIEKQGRGPKITILRTKQKSNWKRKQGHRQPYTRIMIDSINI